MTFRCCLPGGWKRDRNSAHKLMTQGTIACGDLLRQACSCPNRADPRHSIFRASWEGSRVGLAVIPARSRQRRSSHFNRDEYAREYRKGMCSTDLDGDSSQERRGCRVRRAASLKTPVDLTANGGGENPVGLRKVTVRARYFFGARRAVKKALFRNWIPPTRLAKCSR
jgi:hypothetical protein